MIFYLIGALYLVAGSCLSVLIVDAVAEAAGVTELSKLDAQDWALCVVAALLWPLVIAALLWRLAFLTFRRRRTERVLSGLGATHEPKESATDD